MCRCCTPAHVVTSITSIFLHYYQRLCVSVSVVYGARVYVLHRIAVLNIMVIVDYLRESAHMITS